MVGPARRRAERPTGGPRPAADRLGLVRRRTAALFADVPVRASPHYRFEPTAPAGGETSNWAGTLVPTGEGWRRSQLVSRATAELFHALTRPARLPPGTDPLVGARLVLDGILELDGDPAIGSGPAAYSRLGFPVTPQVTRARGVVQRLSCSALLCAARLGIADASIISRLLYRFNTLPASPAWLTKFPDDRAVGRLYEPATTGLGRGWSSFVTTPGAGVSWRAWDRIGVAPPPGSAPTYKLYVSPMPDAMGEACRALLGLGRHARERPFSVKAGNNLPSILRSEKLVAYFVTRDDLFEGAARLAERLAGMRVQGVPFTAELFGDGLISWGVDPGTEAEPPGPLRQLSWRRWITARLATALATALAAGAPVAPVQFALDRVRLDGVDPEGWTAPVWFASSEPIDADH